METYLASRCCRVPTEHAGGERTETGRVTWNHFLCAAGHDAPVGRDPAIQSRLLRDQLFLPHCRGRLSAAAVAFLAWPETTEVHPAVLAAETVRSECDSDSFQRRRTVVLFAPGGQICPPAPGASCPKHARHTPCPRDEPVPALAAPQRVNSHQRQYPFRETPDLRIAEIDAVAQRACQGH